MPRDPVGCYYHYVLSYITYRWARGNLSPYPPPRRVILDRGYSEPLLNFARRELLGERPQNFKRNYVVCEQCFHAPHKILLDHEMLGVWQITRQLLKCIVIVARIKCRPSLADLPPPSIAREATDNFSQEHREGDMRWPLPRAVHSSHHSVMEQILPVHANEAAGAKPRYLSQPCEIRVAERSHSERYLRRRGMILIFRSGTRKHHIDLCWAETRSRTTLTK